MISLRMFRRQTAGRDGGATGGFLLVEALASMAISAVLLAGLVSAVALVTRGSERTARMTESVETTSRALDAIARDLRGAAPVRWGSGGGFVFAGSANELVFARRYSESGEMRVVTLAVQDEPERRTLRSEGILPPTPAGPEAVSWTNVAPVYSGTLLMRFSFLARSAAGQEVLLADWTDVQEMPRAVRVAMTDPRDGTIVSSIRIPIMTDAEPGCAAPSTALCSYVVTGQADAVAADDAPRELIDPNDPAGWMRYAR